MNNETQTEEIDLDLLDRSVAEIEEIPGFDVPPVGTYQFLVNALTKMVPGKDDSGKEVKKPYVVLEYEVVGTVQLADSTAKEAVPGTKFGEMFQLGNEYGESNMKKALVPYVTHFQTDNLRTLVKEKIQNVVVTATLKHRFNKNDKAKEVPYANVVNVNIA